MNKKNNIVCALIVLVFVVTCLTFAACDKNDDNIVPPAPADPTLITSFENVDDLYALTAIEIAPNDEYKLGVNSDKNHVSDGEASLRYTFASGGSHLFCQYIADSHLSDLDVTKLSAVSLDFFNTSDTEQNVTLSVTTSSGAALFSKQQSLSHNAKTTVVYDELGSFTYKRKANVAGFSFRFDVESPVTIYVDNMRVTLGASDVPPEDFNAFTEGIVNVPEQPVTTETLDQNIAFLDAVGYARQLYDGLVDKTTAKAANVELLKKYETLANGYAALYTPRNDTDIVDKWEYGVGLTVGTDVDKDYGAMWSIVVNAKRDGEQSLRFTDVSVDGFGEAVMYVYNPTEYQLQYSLSGGWQSFGAERGKLSQGEWNKISFNASLVENDTVGSLFMIVHRMENGVRMPFDGVFGFSAIYGVPASIVAKPIIDEIATLPVVEEIGLTNKAEVSAVRAHYDNLSRSAKAAVTNYKKLSEAENKIADIEAQTLDDKISVLVATEVTQTNAAVCFGKTVELYNEYRALSNLAYGKVTKIGELNTFKKYLDGYLPTIVKDMTDNLPSADLADFPKVVDKLNQILQLFDLLDEEDRQNIDVDKLAKYKSMASDYALLYDFTDDNLGKISITTDFGNAWQGTMTTQTDVDYGNVLVCDVKSGHAGDFARNAEFRVRDTSVKTAKYEKIVFYVYCPIDQALFRCYPSNWTNPYDVKLSANAWNKIEVDASLFVDGTLDGMFFLFISKEGMQPVGVWKVSDFFGYVDRETTNKLVSGFVDVVNALPETAQLTLADEAMINQATELYRQFKPYCINYISQAVLNKYKRAVDKLAELKQSSVLDKLTSMVNDLTENSGGEEVYAALYYYTSLSKALQKQVDEVVVSKLINMVETSGVKFAAALDADVQNFGANYDFPRQLSKLKVLSDIINGLSDEVYALLSTETSTTVSALNKIGKKYVVVANVGGDAVVDEQYGNTYRLTVKPEAPEQNNLLTLAKGTASGKNIVFYVYRPDGASDAFLYFAGQKNVWTSTDKTSVTISADGWTRVEFAAEDVVNADWTTYWYIYLKDKNVSEESGWLISDIYAY